MKLLIVDDIVDNRDSLERLITQYSRKYKVNVEVHQAKNGQEAVNTCNEKEIDLIFMDIMMPVMNGLEATKAIKKSHPSIMIIVVSSENSEDMKTEILNEGAEDYVLKPFSSAIMLNRLNNYKKLILSRNSIGFQSRAVNTVTHNIYSYQMKFFIGNDDQLAQFWETMLVRFEFQEHISYLSDFVRFLYRLGSYQLQKSFSCHVFLEEDENNFYFTMDNMNFLSNDTIKQMIQKYCPRAIYTLKDNLLSFTLPRVIDEDTAAHTLHSSTAPIETLQTYDILDDSTLEEFEVIVSKLKTEVALMGSSELELDDIDTMNEYLKQLSKILNYSRDAAKVSESLLLFSELLDEYSEDFLRMSEELAVMVSSFINDIILWKEMIFHTGAPSVDFLDSSISSNVQMIRAVFVNDDTEEELDDIFDF